MGWGWTLHDTRSPAEVLQHLHLPVANNSDCDVPPDALGIKPHEVCCGEKQTEYTNICHGDSGSPLVHPGNSSDDSQLKQIGIAARGRQGCSSHYIYAAFVSVSHPDVFNWIGCVTDFISKPPLYLWELLVHNKRHEWLSVIIIVDFLTPLNMMNIKLFAACIIRHHEVQCITSVTKLKSRTEVTEALKNYDMLKLSLL